MALEFSAAIAAAPRQGLVQYIENEEEVESDAMQGWMLSTIAVDNMLNESRDLRDRIQFEEIPSGQEYLPQIIDAMRDSRKLEMKYQSFWSDDCYETVLSPYFLKVFAQRWYVIGTTDRHREPRTYALDRIQKLNTTKEKFSFPKKFVPGDYFRDSFGVFHFDSTPTTVRLRVTGNQEKYFRSLPLHHSQHEVETGEDYAIFEYWMAPAYDFEQTLLSKGPTVEVLEPEWLREDLMKQIEKMKNIYTK